jgi:hypothetical protein
VLPLLYVPVAVNCCVSLGPIDGLAGVTAIEVRVAAVTVRDVEPLIDPDVAVMVVVPAATLEARPELLMLATLVAEEFQVTELVMF